MMAAAKAKAAKKATAAKPAPARSDPAVAAYLKTLEHPLKKDFEAARRIILGASPAIHEGIKWNVPSFATSDYFATFNVRAKTGVEFIFHFGAKAKGIQAKGKIADPKGLLKWLADDRAMVSLGAGKDIAANKSAFEALVRAWIKYL